MTTAREMNDAEGSGTIDKLMTQNWFWRFKKGDTSHKDKPWSKRSSIVEDEALIKIVEQQSSTSIVGLTWSFIKWTIKWYLHRLGYLEYCKNFDSLLYKNKNNWIAYMWIGYSAEDHSVVYVRSARGQSVK